MPAEIFTQSFSHFLFELRCYSNLSPLHRRGILYSDRA